MKKGILIVAFALLVSVVPSFAQAFFPTEKGAFYDQLSAYLSSSSSKQDRDEAAVILQNFRGVWDSYYSGTEANKKFRLWIFRKLGVGVLLNPGLVAPPLENQFSKELIGKERLLYFGRS